MRTTVGEAASRQIAKRSARAAPARRVPSSSHSRQATRLRSAAPGHRASPAARAGHPGGRRAPPAAAPCIRPNHPVTGERAAPWGPANRVTGATHALQEGSDRARRGDLAHQIHIPDVDTQFQRGGRHQHFEFAVAGRRCSARWRFLARHAAVMRHDVSTPRRMRQVARQLVPPSCACSRTSASCDVRRRAPRADRRSQRPRLPGHHRLERPAVSSSLQIAGARGRHRSPRSRARRRGPAPVRKRATAPIGVCVAESPMRVSAADKAARCSSETARCAPRLLPAKA